MKFPALFGFVKPSLPNGISVLHCIFQNFAILDTVVKKCLRRSPRLVALLSCKNPKIQPRSAYSFLEVWRKHLHHQATHLPRYTMGVIRLTRDQKLWHERCRKSRA